MEKIHRGLIAGDASYVELIKDAFEHANIVDWRDHKK